jgi:hypothetical protein
VSELPPATDALLSKPVWTVEDAASFLGIPVKTIYRQRGRRDFCLGYRIGKHLPFEREDVLASFETKRDGA